MTFIFSRNGFVVRFALGLFLLLVCIMSALADDDEPIAFIGHGGFFDQNGQQIPLTSEFVARAQDWYRAKLLSSLTAGKKAESRASRSG
jgi:hypothetical protein